MGRLQDRKARERELFPKIDEANIYYHEFVKANSHLAIERGKTGIMREFESYEYWKIIDAGGHWSDYFKLQNRQSDEEIKARCMKTIEQSKWRTEVGTAKYAWAIPNTKAILSIARYAPILSIGAGSGYWERFIAFTGAEVHAYDKMWEAEQQFGFQELWFPVLMGDQTKVLLHPWHTLFLCWPSYKDSFAYDSLMLTKAKYVIYVGEWMGCTACDKFHNLLETDFKQIARIEIPSYQHIRDHLWIFRRRKTPLIPLKRKEDSDDNCLTITRY